MELGLAGKKALVTGSTKGIGRAIVESLLDEGVDVAICARNSEEVDKAIEDLSAKGRVIGSAVDAGNSDFRYLDPDAMQRCPSRLNHPDNAMGIDLAQRLPNADMQGCVGDP